MDKDPEEEKLGDIYDFDKYLEEKEEEKKSEVVEKKKEKKPVCRCYGFIRNRANTLRY
jgi:hypothetical protein